MNKCVTCVRTQSDTSYFSPFLRNICKNLVSGITDEVSHGGQGLRTVMTAKNEKNV